MTAHWTDRAACRTPGNARLFADRRPHDMTRGEWINAAKGVCHGCDARQDCLDDALTTEGGDGAAARYGIRGGYTTAERAELAGADTTDDEGERI